MVKIGEIARRITGMNKQEIINYDFHAHDHLRMVEIEKRHEHQRRRPIPPALQPPENRHSKGENVMICPKCEENVSELNMEMHKILCASKRVMRELKPSEGARLVRAYRDILEGTKPGDMIYLEGCPNILHGIDDHLHLLQ